MEVDSVVQRLRDPSPYGDAIQKCCDAADWADPRFLTAVRDGLRLRPRIHARQWENVAAFVALADAGKLAPDMRGIAFGSGREPLTFAVGARAGHLTATDLYEADTAWEVARTADPLGFVLGAAPRGFPRERLAVHHMDMRQITYPDAAFDFCYSISAFEHIGEDEDFLRHCREVRRVLKPDGIYALTTEVLFGTETRRTRSNYAFAVDHLLSLFAEAGLQAAPVVDMRLADMAENDPRALVSSRHADPAEPMIQGLTVRDLAGCASVPVCFLLRPAQGAPTPVRVLGRERSEAQTEGARRAQLMKRFSDWVRVNPWGGGAARTRTSLDLWAREPLKPGCPVFGTAFFDFGTRPMEAQLVVAPSPLSPRPAQLSWRVLTWRPATGKAASVMKVGTLALPDPPGAGVARFDFEPQPGHVHALTCRLDQGEALFSAIDLQLRRKPD